MCTIFRINEWLGRSTIGACVVIGIMTPLVVIPSAVLGGFWETLTMRLQNPVT